jgi:hypothetical protein
VKVCNSWELETTVEDAVSFSEADIDLSLDEDIGLSLDEDIRLSLSLALGHPELFENVREPAFAVGGTLMPFGQVLSLNENLRNSSHHAFGTAIRFLCSLAPSTS